MTTATLHRNEVGTHRDDLRLAELVGFLAGYPALDALNLVRAAPDPDPLARVARALVSIKKSAAAPSPQLPRI